MVLPGAAFVGILGSAAMFLMAGDSSYSVVQSDFNFRLDAARTGLSSFLSGRDKLVSNLLQFDLATLRPAAADSVRPRPFAAARVSGRHWLPHKPP